MKAAKRSVEDDEYDDADSAACGPAQPMQLTHHVVAGSRSNSGDDELGTPSKQSCVGFEVHLRGINLHDRRLERLIDRLPWRFPSTVRWLRQPSSVWIRMPAGVLLVCGGLLGFLPILGFWMLPIGLVLLADDVLLLRSIRSRILNRIECRYPRWLVE